MSLISLPCDCLYDITSFLDLRAVGSCLLTCSSLHHQLTASQYAKFIWMNQLNHFLVAEIAYLQLPGNQRKNSNIIPQLKRQLKNQEELLKRFESRSRSYQSEKNRIVGEDASQIDTLSDDYEVDFDSQFAVFSIYSSLKKLFYGGVIRRSRAKMIQIMKRMRDAQSITELFELFEETVKNNDLSAFKRGEDSEELMLIQRQEFNLWNTKIHTKNYPLLFLSGILRLKEDHLVNSENADYILERIIQIMRALVNQYQFDPSEEGYTQSLLLLVIKMNNLDILRAFIPLHNQSIVPNATAQMKFLFNSGMKTERTLHYDFPLATAIKEFVSTDIIELILEEVYEPNRNEMLVAVLGSHPVYNGGRYCSIFNYELSWIQSIIEKYQIDISSISERAFTSAIQSNSSSKPYEVMKYLFSQGLRMTEKHTYSFSPNDPFCSLLGVYGVNEEQEMIQCMEVLLDAGGSVSRLSLFEQIIHYGYSLEVYQFLAKHGVDPNTAGLPNYPPLLGVIAHLSYLEEGFEKVRRLLECGADPTRFYLIDDPNYQNTYMNALRMAYHTLVMIQDEDTYNTITRVLAEYGVTKETEKPDPHGLTFDQWCQVVRQRP